MAIRIRTFRSALGESQNADSAANLFIADIAARGGKFIESHASATYATNGTMFVLTVVCDVPDTEPIATTSA